MDPASSQVCAPWATLADLPEERPSLPAGITWEELLLWATEILWALSGRRWSGTTEDGGCTASAELRDEGGSCAWWAAAGWPALWVGPRHSDTGNAVVQLPHDEATAVESVVVAGQPMSAWRQEGAWLYRTDGYGWRGRTTVITYRWGLAPPAMGVRECVVLALEFAKAVTGDAGCRLPKRVTSVSRQGVSMTMIDPQKFLDDGRTGLTDVDLWLASVNPKARPERGSVWSPDLLRTRSSG
jgi:hypothetical protein